MAQFFICIIFSATKQSTSTVILEFLARFNAYAIESTCFTQLIDFVIGSGVLKSIDSKKWEESRKYEENVTMWRWGTEEMLGGNQGGLCEMPITYWSIQVFLFFEEIGFISTICAKGQYFCTLLFLKWHVLIFNCIPFPMLIWLLWNAYLSGGQSIVQISFVHFLVSSYFVIICAYWRSSIIVLV